MRSLVRMTTVAAMVGMILSLASLNAEAGRKGSGRGRDKKTDYRVELKHPRTGGVVSSRVVDTAAQADALRSKYAKQHWKFWKYHGIGEPLRQRRFGSESAARNYKPPIGIIQSQSVEAGRVTVTEIEAPKRKKGKKRK